MTIKSPHTNNDFVCHSILGLIKQNGSENCDAICPAVIYSVLYNQNPSGTFPIVAWYVGPGSCIVTDCFITAFQIKRRPKQIHLLSRRRKQDVLLTIPQRQRLMFYRPSTAVSRAVKHELKLCVKQNVSFSIAVSFFCFFFFITHFGAVCVTKSLFDNKPGK